MTQPTLALGALVVTIGLADSLNPTTIAPATAFALQENGARRAAAFAAGVAAVSTLAGAVLVAGPGEAIMAAIPHPSPLLKGIGEMALGVILIALAALAWVGRKRLARSLSAAGGDRPRRTGLVAAFGLGAGIMAVELPTAFPYFGAIAAIVGSSASLMWQILLVALFNAAFVLPLVGIVVVRIAAGDRAEDRLQRWRDRLARHAGAVLAVLLGAGGLALVAVGLRAV